MAVGSMFKFEHAYRRSFHPKDTEQKMVNMRNKLISPFAWEQLLSLLCIFGVFVRFHGRVGAMTTMG